MRFYVYELVDPRDEEVFYVGKGQRGRVWEHEREARRGVESEKCERIRAIEADGNVVQHRIVRRFRDEAAAYRFEGAQIEKYGLANLTNVVMGGRGQLSGGTRKSPDRTTLCLLAKILEQTDNLTQIPQYIRLGPNLYPFPHKELVEAVADVGNTLMKRRGKEWIESQGFNLQTSEVCNA